MANSTRRPVQNRDEIETFIANRPGVEFDLAKAIVRRLVFVGPAMLALFGLFRGWDGLVAAAIGVAIVGVYYLLSGWILSATARVSLATYYAGALFGFFVRLVLIGVTMAVLTNLFEMDRVALGATVAVTYVTLLMWEAATYTRASSDRASSSAGREMGETNSA